MWARRIQVRERLMGRGVQCSLVTGQEVTEVPGASHVSCTLEMANIGKPLQIAVIDEYQMIGNHTRGWSVTRAILGLPAQVVYVCGDESAIELLQHLCEECGDELEIRKFQRLSPLTVQKEALGALDAVEVGDCLVAFSRREVHSLKRQIEMRGRHLCCMVYGALPPEARSNQAVLFNTPGNGYDVLVASDAVGMGLNLNIKRLIFTKLEKFDGTSDRPLTVAEVKQVGGRAGRFGSSHPFGEVLCQDPTDLTYLSQAMGTSNPPITQAGLFPRREQLAMFMECNPGQPFDELLSEFAQFAQLSTRYFLANFEDMIELAIIIRHLPLSIEERYIFTTSPCDPSSYTTVAALLNFASVYANRGLVPISTVSRPAVATPKTQEDLLLLEQTLSIYDLYLWLSYRLEDAFEDREMVAERRGATAALIDAGLRKINFRPKKEKEKILRRSRGTDFRHLSFDSNDPGTWDFDRIQEFYERSWEKRAKGRRKRRRG
eukprot:evm.model.scf_100EXC.6 EVM.evm.TU.scf_100EXC.6   scf_100EXC:44762-53616(+)